MKGLWIKDLKLMAAQKYFFLLILLIAIGMSISAEDVSMMTFSLGFVPFVVSLFGLSTISYDEFDNGNAFLFTLPITRKEYVLEKYALSFVLAFVSLVMMFLFTIFMVAQKGMMLDFDGWMIPFGLFALILLLQAIMIPFHLKFGQERGRIAIIVLIGALLLIATFIQKGLEFIGIDWMQVLQSLPILGQGTMLILLYGVSFVLLIISLKISIHIVSKKEF
ncbi:ABC-2 transporter permease [Faecalicoccus pleomorphus]|uniref:ABC-2 transporter permease n=1 Tax=Faecalicoccus pleomorphus TaxID=1323 RepID=UPI001431F0F1|nr:ABC-2 transporter permease [Faecalicoccus pleomorphus]NJE41525.1 ABC-2 transporter permease [Faecalicoccus pleomorphus]